MKLTLLPIAAALAAGGVSADMLTSFTACDIFKCWSWGTWYSDSAVYKNLDVNDGCHDWPGPTGMSKLCMDWGRGRGEMHFVGQDKRCILKHDDKSKCSEGECKEADWWEVGCTW